MQLICNLARMAVPMALALLVLHPLGRSAEADVWVYEDAQGRMHFADTPRHAGFRRMSFRTRQPSREHKVARIDGPTNHWDRVIARAGRDHHVEPGLVKAVIHVESHFDSTAVSHKGAKGLMQLMPGTAIQVGVDDPFDPWQNIRGGTRYLGQLMRRYQGDLELSLAAYNAGESAVARFGGMPPYLETRRYVKRVLALHRRYDADFR